MSSEQEPGPDLGSNSSLYALNSSFTTDNSTLSDLDNLFLESLVNASFDSQCTNPDLIPSVRTPNVAQTTQRKERGRTSFVYKWQRDGVASDHVFRNNKGEPEWRCMFCSTNYKISGGTACIKRHLNWHDISENSAADK